MLHDRVMVKPDGGGERRSNAGIVIPATAEVAKRLVWGEVFGVGQPRPHGEGRRPGAVRPRRPVRGRRAGRRPTWSCGNASCTRWRPSGPSTARGCTCDASAGLVARPDDGEGNGLHARAAGLARRGDGTIRRTPRTASTGRARRRTARPTRPARPAPEPAGRLGHHGLDDRGGPEGRWRGPQPAPVHPRPRRAQPATAGLRAARPRRDQPRRARPPPPGPRPHRRPTAPPGVPVPARGRPPEAGLRRPGAPDGPTARDGSPMGSGRCPGTGGPAGAVDAPTARASVPRASQAGRPRPARTRRRADRRHPARPGRAVGPVSRTSARPYRTRPRRSPGRRGDRPRPFRPGPARLRPAHPLRAADERAAGGVPPGRSGPTVPVPPAAGPRPDRTHRHRSSRPSNRPLPTSRPTRTRPCGRPGARRRTRTRTTPSNRRWPFRPWSARRPRSRPRSADADAATTQMMPRTEPGSATPAEQPPATPPPAGDKPTGTAVRAGPDATGCCWPRASRSGCSPCSTAATWRSAPARCRAGCWSPASRSAGSRSPTPSASCAPRSSRGRPGRSR